jgi:Zn-dependent protease/CBS domain-containing protein
MQQLTTKQPARPGRSLLIAGFPVRVGWSAVAVVAVVAWSLAARILPLAFPGYAAGTYWAAGILTGALFLGSVLTHELGHALLARRSGLVVEDITLWAFGGLARIRGDAPNPGAELRIAAVGPLTSLALGVGFLAAAVGVGAAGLGGIAGGVLYAVAGINLVLAVFNLVPGAPLDGGRILRAALWRWHGDRARATLAAARTGQVVGVALVAAGLVQVLATGQAAGLWNALVGWFVYGAARAEGDQAALLRNLEDLRVADVMTPDPPVGPAWFTVQAFLDGHALDHRLRAYPVQDFDGRLAGLVPFASLLQVPPERRGAVRVGALAIPVEQLVGTRPDEPLGELVGRLSLAGHGWALVFDGGRLAGVVTPDDLAMAAERRLGPRRAGPLPAAAPAAGQASGGTPPAR